MAEGNIIEEMDLCIEKPKYSLIELFLIDNY